MVLLPRFEVEDWMDRLELTPGVLNIAETCCDSVSIDDLNALSNGPKLDLQELASRRLTYGPIPGSEALRGNIAALYDEGSAAGAVPPDQVVVTPGAIMANYLLFYALVGPGDHVICVYPTYQQLYEVPKSLGADVSLWKLREENGWVPDISELESLAKPNTKMIVINNPNNPFGSVMSKPQLEEIARFAKSRDIILFGDEVYRPLFHSLPSGTTAPPSVLSLGYPKAISTSSMSKAYSLAGIRVGWIATRDRDIAEAVLSARHYTTISVSQLDDAVAAFALSDGVRPALMRRNMELARRNCELMDEWVQKSGGGACDWTRPVAGTTAMVRFRSRETGQPVKDGDFCLELLKETGALVMPGSTCFGGGVDFEGYMRVGYVCRTETLMEALTKMSAFIEKRLA